jgi:hypothetical protein
MANLYFRVGNDYTSMDISDADFVIMDMDKDEIVENELPQTVLDAINVLRQYAETIDGSEALVA